VPAATPLPRGPSVLTLYTAADLLTAPGCPVCRYATEASDRYLGWFALEGHAQPAMITRLCSSLGMCGRHTRLLMSQPGAAIRLTAVYRYVVTGARDRLAGHPAPPAPCPACEHDEAAAGRALDTLLDDLADPSVLDRLRELGGLCLPHLAAATVRSRRVAPLAKTARDTIAARDLRCDWLAGTDHDARARAALRSAVPATGSPGAAACAPCLAGAQAEQDALARLTPPASDAPDPAPTLCASHLADVALAAGPRGIRPLLAWQLQCLTSQPSAGRAQWLRMGPRRRDVSDDCAVCRARRAAIQRRLAGPRETRQLPGADAALCARHHLVLRAAGPRGTQLLADTAVRRADELAAELADAFDRISRARSTGIPVPESTAWQRAAAFLDGSVFGGRRGPPPAGALHQ
jgi:hypothetical protein